MEHLFGIFIYIPILVVCVIFGMFIRSWVIEKLDGTGDEWGAIIGGAVGLFFLFPLICNFLGLG